MLFHVISPSGNEYWYFVDFSYWWQLCCLFLCVFFHPPIRLFYGCFFYTNILGFTLLTIWYYNYGEIIKICHVINHNMLISIIDNCADIYIYIHIHIHTYTYMHMSKCWNTNNCLVIFLKSSLPFLARASPMMISMISHLGGL